jgi:hypothetical protein
MTKVLPLLRAVFRRTTGATASCAASEGLRISRYALLGISMLALAACSDAPLGPSYALDRVEAARVLPAVIDARVRIAAGIENMAIRDRVTYDLSQLEVALASGNGNGARFHVRVVVSVLTEYKAQPGSAVDAADISGILLAMNAVTNLVGTESMALVI